MLKRPQDFDPAELPEIIDLAQRGDLVAWYRRSRVKIDDGRAAPPVEPGYNFNINKWSLYAQGGTYLLPVNELTALYINALLETFDETMALFDSGRTCELSASRHRPFRAQQGRPSGG